MISIKKPVKYSYIFFCLIFLLNLSGSTITVTNSGNSGTGTLRQAVLDAVDNDVIVFDGSVTFVTLSSNIEINKNITIDGPGADVFLISGGETAGIFHVNTSGTTTIRDISFTYGRGGEEAFTNGGFTFVGGGAIFHESGMLDVLNCEFANNSSNAGNGSTSFDYGGAIFILDDITMTNCTFENNSISGPGGISGGAVHIFKAATVNILNSTFINNTSPNEGGAIVLDEYPSGPQTVIITNCTFFDNIASGAGFGEDIHVLNGADLTLHNNIFDRSSGSSMVSVDFNGAGSQTSRGGNIYRDTPTFSTIASDDVNQGISSSGVSSTLQANNTLNGTRTLRISASGSLANNNGTTGFDETSTDARGASRNGNTDSGAYEYWGDNGLLPVELLSFSAELIDETLVLLNWHTATEVNNYGFNVECRIESARRGGNGEWETKGFVQGYGTTNSPKEYTYTDSELPDANEVSYRLKQIDNDGTFTYSKIVTVDLTTVTSVDDELNYQFSLAQNYPNPFNPITTITFTVPSNVRRETSNVKLMVYDILGREVATLVNQKLQSGNHEINFDASRLSTGMFFYRIDVGSDFSSTRKMLLLK